MIDPDFADLPIQHTNDKPRDHITLLIGQEPVSRQLVQVVHREDTFFTYDWANRVKFAEPSSANLAAAGFHCTGHHDIVRCFWCGLGLHQWRAGDDPWRRHAASAPTCPWVLRVRGREFVIEVAAETLGVPINSPVLDYLKARLGEFAAANI